ncbi:lysis system i-spanin subunit Rz [Pseudomonas sp. COR18]|uniref:lysis system i-spanin subunit Rz n=1 Tax=Pseudomonas sp. COR18 TaxID=3399680 RepID=UPI003B00202F
MTFSPLPLLLVVLIAAGGAWFSFDQVLQQRDSARSERDVAQYEVAGLREAARLAGERLAQAAAIDLKHTQELSNALKTNQDLQLAVDRRNQWLRVNATCSATGERADTGAGGVADAGSPELTADARQAYFTLRDQLAVSRQMILGLQDYVRTFCITQPTTGETTP